MSDITVIMIEDSAQIEGNSDDGVEFIDAWQGYIEEVIDSGIIIVSAESVVDMDKAAKHAGVSFEVEEGA